MRRLALVAIGLIGCVATPAPPPAPLPSASPVAVQSPTCARRDSVADLASTPASPRPSPSAFPDQPLPGRLVFEANSSTAGTTVTVYERGSLRAIALPGSPLPGSRLHASSTGDLIAGLIAADQSIVLWTYSPATGATRSTTVAAPRWSQPRVIWSPDSRHIVYEPDVTTVQSEAYLVALDGPVVRVGVPGMYIYDIAWRTNDEFSLMTQDGGPRAPVVGASIFRWSVTGREIEQYVLNVQSESGVHIWSPDGRELIYGDLDRGLPPGPAAEGLPRLVRRTDAGTNIVISAADLRSLPNGCDLVRTPTLSPFGWWSPDQTRFAAIGKMPPTECCWFLAIAPISGGTPALFRAPASCYLNGQGAWIDASRLVVELTGPTCGRTDQEGRAVIIDAATGRALSEFPIGRKSSLTLSPDHRWVANGTDGGLDVILLDDPSKRVTLPVNGALLDWCCE